MAAYNAIPSTGGVLYFPEGTFLHSAVLSFTSAKPVAVVGAGKGVTTLQPYPFTATAISVNGPTNFTFRDITVSTGNLARDVGSYLVSIQNCAYPLLQNLHLATPGTGTLLYLNGCTTIDLRGVSGTSTGFGNADTCLRINNCGGVVSNCQMSVGATTGYATAKPAVYITNSNSLEFANCGFGGCGPRSVANISSVASDAAKFTVTTATSHGHAVGDLVVIQSATVAGYNSEWRVATVPTATTFTVTSTLNPGASGAVGTVSSIPATLLLSNEGGAVNECTFTGCLFAGNQSGVGSTAVYLDGRRSALDPIQGIAFAGCYFDSGQTGVLIAGTSTPTYPTVTAISIVGGTFNSGTRQVHIEQGVAGVHVEAASPSAVVAPADDGVSASAAVYVYAGAETNKPKGLTLRGQLGMERNWTGGFLPYKYGVLLDGAGINDLNIVGAFLFGSTAPMGFLNSALAAAQRWVIRDNHCASGTLPITNSTYLPSVASAVTIDLSTDPHETFKITGTTNIGTISGGWIGRELCLLFVGALSLVTAGNLAIGANRSILAGDMVRLVFDGTSWYVR